MWNVFGFHGGMDLGGTLQTALPEPVLAESVWILVTSQEKWILATGLAWLHIQSKPQVIVLVTG